MLVLSICCFTGSCVHRDQQNSAIQLKKYIYVITGLYSADAVTSLAIVLIATLGFLHIPGVVVNLPLSVKVVMIAGGTLLFVGDTVYLIYRMREGKRELQHRYERLKGEYLDKLDKADLKLAEKSVRWHAIIHYLENELIPKNQSNVQDANILDKEKAEHQRNEALEFLNYSKAMLEENLAMSEKLTEFQHAH